MVDAYLAHEENWENEIHSPALPRHAHSEIQQLNFVTDIVLLLFQNWCWGVKAAAEDQWSIAFSWKFWYNYWEIITSISGGMSGIMLIHYFGVK